MTDEVPLPELRRTTLDADGVRELVDAIASTGAPAEATLKYGATARAKGTVTLEEAASALVSGDAVGAQFRYAFEGSVWIDTIVRRPGGFEVVRIEQTF